MSLYEPRTYTLYVGKRDEAVKPLRGAVGTASLSHRLEGVRDIRDVPGLAAGGAGDYQHRVIGE